MNNIFIFKDYFLKTVISWSSLSLQVHYNTNYFSSFSTGWSSLKRTGYNPQLQIFAAVQGLFLRTHLVLADGKGDTHCPQKDQLSFGMYKYHLSSDFPYSKSEQQEIELLKIASDEFWRRIKSKGIAHSLCCFSFHYILSYPTFLDFSKNVQSKPENFYITLWGKAICF